VGIIERLSQVKPRRTHGVDTYNVNLEIEKIDYKCIILIIYCCYIAIIISSSVACNKNTSHYSCHGFGRCGGSARWFSLGFHMQFKLDISEAVIISQNFFTTCQVFVMERVNLMKTRTNGTHACLSALFSLSLRSFYHGGSQTLRHGAHDSREACPEEFGRTHKTFCSSASKII
jgi:hypothetical protein